MANIKHMFYGTPTYKSWAEMKYRCNHNIKKYKNISFCESWNNFENFYKDMGERPKNTSLDRINPNGNYEPNNCRWATSEQQQNNRTNNNKIYFNGKTLTISQWAKLLNIKRSTLAQRIYCYKWSIEKSLTKEG